MHVARALMAAALTLSPLPASAQTDTAPSARALFDAWLEVFNSGDEAAIRAFHSSNFGDDNPVYPLEVAEDSCGLDLVRTTGNDAKIEALAVERCFPSLRRITIEHGKGENAPHASLAIGTYALSAEGAAKYVLWAAERLAEKDKFAGTLLIVPRGKEGWSRSFGYADLERQKRVTADTPFLLASAGKMFTTVAILQLVEEGKVELDAPLGRYLPDYPNAEMAKTLTIRHLLTHRGGTGDMQILRREEGANRARVSSIADIIALNGSRGPSFPPGSRGEYSNYGMILLGAVIEAASGQDYYDYVQQRIFDPAGMTQSGFPLVEDMDDVAVGLTTFYGEEDRLGPHSDVLPWRGTPAGGGVASANDMLRFLGAVEEGKLLSHETFEQALVPSETSGWGLGFVVNPDISWGHGGGSYGMDVAAHHHLPNDTTFICLAARDSVCNRMIHAWFSRTFGLTE